MSFLYVFSLSFPTMAKLKLFLIFSDKLEKAIIARSKPFVLNPEPIKISNFLFFLKYLLIDDIDLLYELMKNF